MAVATFRRVERLPLLIEKLREQLSEVARLGDIDARVVFIDNDPERTAEATVRAVGDSRVAYVHESVPGVVAVRNRALDESATSDALVFIDDDELPRDKWLISLVQAWRGHAVHGVAGPVVSVADGDLDEWVVASRSNERLHRVGLRDGAVIDRAATNNLLLDRQWVGRLALRFDERFGLTGGEDSFFTRQLVRAGGRLIWCADAVVEDLVPAERMNRSYNLHRAYTLANAGARVDLLLERGMRRQAIRAKLLAAGVVRVALGSFRVIRGRLQNSLGMRAAGERWVARAKGELSAAVGLVARPYARKG